MARPREFNPDDAVEQAMQAVWSKGYEATSLSDLTRAMGISRSSFYETFGSKHGLFLEAIERYRDTTVERAVAELEGDGPARAAIAGVFGRVVDNAVGRGDRRGCFVCNCATEVSPHDPEAAARVAACLGTHTHVPTADARVLPGGTAYISDVGMTGSRDGVIGVRREQAVESLRKMMPIRFDTAEENVWINAVVVEVRPDGLADSIEQVLVPAPE